MKREIVLFILGCAAFTAKAPAVVKLPPVISDHMVIQRGVPVPIWGTGAPGEKITVEFRDQRKFAEADARGKWTVRLDPVQVGDPATLTVVGTNTIAITDVLVGEVWVGSGQSNMDTPVAIYVRDTTASAPPDSGENQATAAGQSIKDAVSKYHIADEVLAQLAKADYPQLRFISSRDGQGWKEANPRNIPQFSALLFTFGRQLQKELNVPVGLVFGALGATSSEQWISKEAYQSDEACKVALVGFSATYSADAEQKQYEVSFANWQKAMAAWNQSGHPPGSPPPADPHHPFRPGDVTRDIRQPNKNIGDLYELYVRPFIPFAIRGVLWDQGEGGTGIFGLDQYSLMGALIKDWRKDWGQGDFPFIYVQKPSGGGCAWDPADPVTMEADAFTTVPPEPPVTHNGVERETYIRILRYPNTAMVSTSDLGGGTHPINKSGYGTRASRVALGAVYGRKIEFYGPVYDSFSIEGDKIRVHFTHTGLGLAFRQGNKLQGFAIAGGDKLFHWAEAVIDGDTVVASSREVAKPVALRYAWDARHPWANLFNKDGLPALEFRTDDWSDIPVSPR